MTANTEGIKFQRLNQSAINNTFTISYVLNYFPVRKREWQAFRAGQMIGFWFYSESANSWSARNILLTSFKYFKKEKKIYHLQPLMSKQLYQLR